MGKRTGIEWTATRDAAGKVVMPGASWNPWHGCHKIDPLCKFCYMFREKRKYGQEPNVVVRSKTTFYDPLSWKEPRFCFTCSWSDWCIEEADEWRPEAWSVIKRTPHITYQILTKRTDRLARCLPDDWDDGRNYPHVWLGFSAGTQESLLRRWSEMQGINARVIFLSAEPLLERISIAPLMPSFSMCRPTKPVTRDTFRAVHEMMRAASKSAGMLVLDWVITGGETGTAEEDIRITDVDDVRRLRDEANAFGLPFNFKQYGDWYPLESADEASQYPDAPMHELNGRRYVRIGKKKAGRTLDGRVWDEMPASLEVQEQNTEGE